MLASLYVTPAALLAGLAGRSVALVGNARALAEGQNGAEIDAHDVVVRINLAPMPSATSHGTRTDWLALATRLSQKERRRINPSRILWMSPKRKRLDWRIASSPGFYLHPLTDVARLGQKLGAPPTTGLMMVDLLAQSDLRCLTLYGFDFFASQSLSGRRNAAQVPHDFDAEAAFFAEIMAQDSRIRRV